MHQSTGSAYAGHVHSSRCRGGYQADIVSGQEPEDIHGKLVGQGDFAAQVRQVFANLGRALAASAARPQDVAKITIYVVDYRLDDHYPIIEAARVTPSGITSRRTSCWESRRSPLDI